MEREMTLKDIQRVGLDILKDIHSFCEQHKLRYAIGGGSLLGAIRHNGFIPWDDDIDLMMPRDDYEIFCRTYVSDKFVIVSKHNDHTCMTDFSRVCDSIRTRVEGAPWTKKDVGLWVDVMPFDGVEDDFSKFEKKCKKLDKLWRSIFINRSIQQGVMPETSKKMATLIRCIKVLKLDKLNQLIARIKLDILENKARKIKFGETQHCSQIIMLQYGAREYYDIKDFQSVVKVDFEGFQANAIVGYDNYLKVLYGDYMKLPPVEDRVPKLGSLKFYWRNE